MKSKKYYEFLKMRNFNFNDEKFIQYKENYPTKKGQWFLYEVIFLNDLKYSVSYPILAQHIESIYHPSAIILIYDEYVRTWMKNKNLPLEELKSRELVDVIDNISYIK